MSAAPAARRITLCADDYGLSPGVNRAICDLVARGRINATSVMTVAPAFDRTHAQTLLACARDSGTALGLHVTLTAPFHPLTMHFRPLHDHAFLPFRTLMRAAFARRLDADIVRAEIAAQLTAFSAAFGRPPDFVDGHQHVHLYPVVREAFVGAVKDAAPASWVRQCARHLPLAKRFDNPKALFLDMLSLGLQRRAARAGLSVNPGFAGAYDFSKPTDFAALFPGFLAGLPDRGVVMCHPGIVDELLTQLDPLTGAREREYAYFGSESFTRTLALENVTLL